MLILARIIINLPKIMEKKKHKSIIWGKKKASEQNLEEKKA